MIRYSIPIVLCLFAHGAIAQQKMTHDSSFHAMQLRGRLIMGVDQYTSTHVFQDRPDGGRIELQRDRADAEGTTVIRAHLKSIGAAFAAGDFTAPALVHMKPVPGVDVMAAKRALIKYEFRELPRGGELLIRTSDPAAIKAVHAFLKFQRSDHHR